MDKITLDKIKGMFMGAFLGDALGAPHEFKCNALTPYSGKLDQRAFHISKFQGRRELEIGQITDDSEMTLALLRQIVDDGKYVKDNVIMSYIKWANSGIWMMGNNIRSLLKGVSTIRGYNNRINKVLLLPVSDISQSNGSLMRSSPLALLSDNDSIVEDVTITNPNPVTIDCNLIHVNALRLALMGYDRYEIFSTVKMLAQTDDVKNIFDQIEKGTNRNISVSKGWCLHALWCTMTTLLYFDGYASCMKNIISIKGSDTDTNACIAGALIGAVMGFKAMQMEKDTNENIEILLSVKIEDGPTPRPKQYTLHDFHELTEKACVLANKLRNV